MKISEAIAQLQQVLAEEGDLEMFDGDGYGLMRMESADASDHGFPQDWNIPDRFLHIVLNK